MKILKYVLGLAVAITLTACGGGGGSGSATAGSSAAATTPAVTGAGETQTTSVGTVALELLSGAGVATNSISAVEIAQVRVTVKDPAGVLVSGTIVSFSEVGVGLLKFSPASQTAMTNSSGIAVMEVRAADAAKVGATSVSVTATVAGQTTSAVKVLEITNAPVTGGVAADPQLLASSINFLSTDPSDKSIVLAGAGGNGRTETGVLKFRVVDKNGTPVKGALVDFVVNPSNNVTLNIAQGTSDADGVAITSVSSKTVATSVVVTATVHGQSISTQSDQLKVTTGVGVDAGFEILPLAYNLDGALSGDSTTVTARLVDVNGNPVADGVPVVFVASGGKVGTSSAGGCNTVDGKCSVPFEVQEPRPADGMVVVKGSATVGKTTTLLRQITLHMSSAAFNTYENSGGIPATSLVAPLPITLVNCGKLNKTYMISNSLGYSAPPGTGLAAVGDAGTGLNAAVGTDNTVLDVPSFGPSSFKVVIDPASATNPPCSIDGLDSVASTFEVTATAPKSKRVAKRSIAVTYPAGALQLITYNTANKPVAIKLGACSYETTRVEAVGTDGLTLPAGSVFNVSTDENSAVVEVSTVAPTLADPLASPQSQTLALPSNSASRQSLWIRIRAPSGGASPCDTSTPTEAATFDLSLTVLSTNGKRNTQSVTVTYPKAKAP